MTTPPEPEINNRWWVIAEVELLAALRRVANGDDPDLAMAELVANSKIDNEEPP